MTTSPAARTKRVARLRKVCKSVALLPEGGSSRCDRGICASAGHDNCLTPLFSAAFEPGLELSS